MQKFLLLVFVLFSAVLFSTAQNYTQHTATDRFLLIFEKEVSAEQKSQLIEASGLVTGYTHIPAPSLTICFTGNYQVATNYFASLKEIKAVSFFITDGKYHAGVLNEMFIKINDENFEPFLLEKLKANGLTSFRPDKYVPNLYLVQLPKTDKNTLQWCEIFKAEPWCSYATPNYLLNPLVNSTDPLYNRQWNIDNKGTTLQGSGTPDADMDVDSAWTLTTGDPNIKISIIDSGVDTLHEDLKDNMLPGHDAVNDSTDGYPTPAYQEDGHGTCCAGIVAAVKDNLPPKGIAGVAPSCKIIPVRAFYYILLQGASDPLPFSTAAAFSDAIGWSWSVANADILSNSWGLPPTLIGLLQGGTQPVEDAIQQAHTSGRNGKGVAMFFSSGNENGTTGPIWPASMAQTIAVNATSMCDERKSPSDCSGENWGGDHGPGLDFSAPGVKISTTDMTGNKGFTITNYYYSFNGTSAACPNAAGVGALLLSLRSDLTAEDVRNIIAQTAEKVGGYNYDTTLTNGTWCPELGYGRVNAYNALQYAFVYSSVNEQEAQNTLKVFPNPTNGLLYIHNDYMNAEWKLLSVTGAVMLNGSLEKGVNTLDASAMPAGVYLLAVKTLKGWITSKISILR